jgi:tetratricopeptide (TPR) repeat protein
MKLRTFQFGVLLAWGSIAFVPARAEDVVYLTAEGNDSGRLTVRGEIVDFTGEAITVGRPPAPPRRYPAERVLLVETEWNMAHQAAKLALGRRDYQTAAQQLAEANRSEQRTWVRRLILTDLMRCYEALGQLEQAGDLFLAIAASDPSTPACKDAPLPWFSDDRVSRAKAEVWLNTRDQPAAQLLGASWLLMTADPTAAQQVLRELAAGQNLRLAALAEAQLWRGGVTRATVDDAARWALRIEQMPADVRAGPYFVLASAYDRLGLADEASLAYLSVPVHYPKRRELAARALVAAAHISRRAGHVDEATELLSEVVTDYGDTALAAEAKSLLAAPR